MWCCEISYPIAEYFNNPLDEKLDTLAQKYGAKNYASGAGFGYRDVAYEGFAEQDDAETFGACVMKLGWFEMNFQVYRSGS